MKFPGKRKNKHYFPVTEKSTETFSLQSDLRKANKNYVCGIDQLLVDIEIRVSDEDLLKWNIARGESHLVDDSLVDEIYNYYFEKGEIHSQYPGGTVGNTLHNFSILADSESAAMGCINNSIQVGDYSYKYLCNTSSKVNLSYLQPCPSPMGRALCLISDDAERSFLISKGCMNDLNINHIYPSLIEKSSALLLSAYPFRDIDAPISQSSISAAKIAHENEVPVVFTLGTHHIVSEKREELQSFIKDFVSILAMNKEEGHALTGLTDPLQICENILDNYCDFVLLTDGAEGLYIGAYVDKNLARKTKQPLHSKSVVNYNEYEYSRAMLKKHSKDPVKIFNHINPFMGGPRQILNTNGAGDGALAALLHDIVANDYHKEIVPQSPKHDHKFLTYSSISQISKYANRVSYQILSQHSSRLLKGLPQKEDSLEEAYWDK